MRSTFHELELDKVAIQNATAVGTEQLVVTLKPGSQAQFQFEIRENSKEGSDGTTSSLISIDQHGVKQLFNWFREAGVLQ
ncbi:MAG: hypothetical protein K0S28_350 [Paucimonas sp.]|jgi:hypothetical protein|nr:hypothetical protein [Paucimonas sp.]